MTIEQATDLLLMGACVTLGNIRLRDARALPASTPETQVIRDAMQALAALFTPTGMDPEEVLLVWYDGRYRPKEHVPSPIWKRAMNNREYAFDWRTFGNFYESLCAPAYVPSASSYDLAIVKQRIRAPQGATRSRSGPPY